MRYKQLPSLIAAGHNAAQTAFPIVARCDFYWNAQEATSNHQYVFLNDTLVAPIWNNDSQRDGVNVSSREVWVPPGSWHDAVSRLRSASILSAFACACPSWRAQC